MNLAGLYNTLRRITPVINSVTQGIGSLNAGMNALQAAAPEYKQMSAVDAVNATRGVDLFADPIVLELEPHEEKEALIKLLSGVNEEFPEAWVPKGRFVDTADVKLDYSDWSKRSEIGALWDSAGAVPVNQYSVFDDSPEVIEMYPDYYTWDAKDAEMQNAQRKEYARQHPLPF